VHPVRARRDQLSTRSDQSLHLAAETLEKGWLSVRHAEDMRY